MLCTAYSPFVFRLVNSRIPGTTLKEGKGNDVREVCTRTQTQVFGLVLIGESLV